MEITPVKRKVLYAWIEKALTAYEELTAHEIAQVLHKAGVVAYPVRDSVQPRITEMCKLGKVTVCGSKVDESTHKRVSIYKLVE